MKKILAILIVLMLLASIWSAAGAQAKCPESAKVCVPGFPSGWWYADCRNGGWAALRNGCTFE